MLEAIVGLFWTALLGCALVGLAFAIPFLIFWSGWLDPGAKTGSFGFRLMILPGVVALWPLLVVKTFRGRNR
jgi:tetrahydromethanopterin S-methyltransferase subunit E